MSDRLNFPIWADADTTSTGFTLQHLVNGSWVDTDMRTCALPAGYTNEVCLNRYIEKDIKSTVPNLNYSGTTGITPQPDAYQIYRMVTGGVPTLELGFFNDWSYEMFTGDTRCISAPINRHADSRQHLLYGNFAETGNSIIVKEMIRPDIKMQPNSIAIGAEAEGHTITAVITSNMDFELILPEWLTASQTAFTSGTTVAYLYPQTNTSFDSRQFTIQAKHEGYWSPDYEYTNLAQVAQSGKVAYLTITPDPVGISYSGGSTYVTVYTNTDFTATTNSSDTWLTYSGKTEVGTNYYNVYFNISANTGDNRQTHVYFEYLVNSSGGTYTRALRVVQAKAPDITIEPQSKDITASAQGVRIRVSSEANWVASTTYTWLSVPSSGISGVTLIYIDANKNVSAEPRSGSVIFSNGAKQVTFSIVQSASTNVIRYTSTDDTVIVPKNTTGFGATYVDSVYYPESHVGYLLFESEPTSIGKEAFFSKNKLASIEVPDSVTTIDDEAFMYCRGLTAITIGSGVTSIGADAFNSCTKLSSITIPDSVTSIGLRGFSKCSGLTSIALSSGLTTIGNYAFENCSGLTSISIPTNTTTLGNYMFSGCTALSSLTFGVNIETFFTRYITFSGSAPRTWFRDMPTGFTLNCTDISIPGYSEIEFSGTTMYVSRGGYTVPVWIANTYSNFVEDAVIYNYSSTTQEGTLGIYFLKYMAPCLNNWHSAHVAGTLRPGTNVSGMKYIKLPNCIKVDSNTIDTYQDLTTFDFGGDDLTEITGYMFAFDTSLTTITIPKNVTKIQVYAFYGCTALTTINYNGTVAEWNNILLNIQWNYGVPATVVHCTDGDAPI